MTKEEQRIVLIEHLRAWVTSGDSPNQLAEIVINHPLFRDDALGINPVRFGRGRRTKKPYITEWSPPTSFGRLVRALREPRPPRLVYDPATGCYHRKSGA